MKIWNDDDNVERTARRIQESAQRVLEAVPEARSAIQNAMDRLNAPFYVRAWHQLKGDEGWGRGQELHTIIAALALAGILGALWLFG